MRRWKLALVLIVLLAWAVVARGEPNHWSGLDRLEGTWVGMGSGFGASAPVTHSCTQAGAPPQKSHLYA